MSSADFSKVKVISDVLDTTDSVKYAVCKGAQNITPSVYNAISSSNSSITFNIQTPSESTVIARRIMLSATLNLNLQYTYVGGQAANVLPFNYGQTEALAPFPLQSILNTIQMTVNNNTVSQNQRDVMFQLLRFNDRRELARYNNATPTMYDSYYNYSDAVLSNNNPLGAWNDVANDQDFQPRGTFALNSVTGNQVTQGGAQVINVLVSFTTIEPLMISPLIWCDPKSNNQGFYGIQVFNLVLNVGDASRIVRSARPTGNGTLVTTLSVANNVPGIQSPQLFIQYYTRQPSDLVPARNVVPYAEYPRYISPLSCPALTPAVAVAGCITPTTQSQVNSQSISLNSIPDKLIIVVRRSYSSIANPYASDSFVPITGININFNNKAGLLTSATQWDLWRMSVEAGSNQTWAEFSGVATKGQSGIAGAFQVPTCGSVLCLEMGKHIELDDVFAPGSIGQFQLQFKLNLANYTADNLTSNLEICLITMNSGVFVLERGTSQTYTAILSRSDVLSASAQPSYSGSEVARLVGGGWEDMFKSVKNIADKGLGYARTGCKMLGNGQPSGGNSGAPSGGNSGAPSGGKLSAYLK